MKTAAVIQHLAIEGLDGFAPVLAEKGYNIVAANAAYGVPRIFDDAELLIVLGGPISANDDKRYPFIKDELRLIEHRIKRKLPVFGICLGAQLIARALGAKVYPSGGVEIGFSKIRLTTDGKKSCLRPYATKRIALHWHGDTFDLPSGAKLLASTKFCKNQAFSRGAEVVGIQFHPEATGDDLAQWLVGHTSDLSSARIDVNAMRNKAAGLERELQAKSRAVIGSWLGELERKKRALAKYSTSTYGGKTIVVQTQNMENPRQRGSHGHRSFQLLIDAGGSLKYEHYRFDGGRVRDLQWDLNRGYVTVED